MILRIDSGPSTVWVTYQLNKTHSRGLGISAGNTVTMAPSMCEAVDFDSARALLK